MKIRDQSSFVLDICTLGYDFAQREIDHLLWVATLRDSIDAHDPNFTIELILTGVSWALVSGIERDELEKTIPKLAPVIAELRIIIDSCTTVPGPFRLT